MTRTLLPCLVLALSLPVTAGNAGGSAQLPPFSGPQGLLPWTATYLPSVKKQTRFNLVEDAGLRVLRVETDASAGTLVLTVPSALRRTSILRWRWKLDAHNPATDPRKKKGDDYPLRLYVLFDYDPGKLGIMDRTKLRLARRMYGDHLPAAALCYVWDPGLERDTVIANAFTDRVRMVIVRGGSTDLGRWVSETRDVRRDFRRAFNEDAPDIQGIAIAGDGDNTGASSTALIGDLTLEP